MATSAWANDDPAFLFNNPDTAVVGVYSRQPWTVWKGAPYFAVKEALTPRLYKYVGGVWGVATALAANACIADLAYATASVPVYPKFPSATGADLHVGAIGGMQSHGW